MEALQAANYGWLSILPPLIAIILALTTKEVISSLLVGILSGALIYSRGNVIQMIISTFTVMGERMGENVNILIFLGLLGALVVIVTKAGGSAAYGEWAARKITTRRGASIATGALGCLIFIDDYFNCLTVGTVMRPVTDKYRISRSKLSYLLDATAAPICIIAPVSSWGASVASYIEDTGVGNGMNIFVRTIPFNLYAILTIIMIVIVSLTKVQFGPMGRKEKVAIETGDVFDGKGEQGDDGMMRGKANRGTVVDLVLPIFSLIVFTIIAMIYTGGGFEGAVSLSKVLGSFGNTDASLSLVIGSFLSLIFTFALFLPRKVISFHDFMNGITEGIRSMVPAFAILLLAWTIGGICSVNYLNTGGCVGNLINHSNFPVYFLPVIIFIVSGFLGFATGTSWGTMALLVPIGVAITTTPGTTHLLLPVLGAILAGAVYGDHISPISDTTILSSTGAGCDHIDHISTQMVYATVVAASAAIGFLLMGFLKGAVVPFVVSLVVMLGTIYIANQRFYKKETIDYSKVNH